MKSKHMYILIMVAFLCLPILLAGADEFAKRVDARPIKSTLDASVFVSDVTDPPRTELATKNLVADGKDKQVPTTHHQKPKTTSANISHYLIDDNNQTSMSTNRRPVEDLYIFDHSRIDQLTDKDQWSIMTHGSSQLVFMSGEIIGSINESGANLVNSTGDAVANWRSSIGGLTAALGLDIAMDGQSRDNRENDEVSREDIYEEIITHLGDMSFQGQMFDNCFDLELEVKIALAP